MTPNVSSSPTVSVIVPVYNTERFLPICIDSILAQTFSDFELIIIDDGSTDNSPAIIADHAASDSRIVTLSQPNGGLSAARNTGLDAVRGDYISFVDADDMLHPRFLETLMKMMQPEVDIAACSATSRQHDGLPLWQDSTRDFVTELSGHDALESMLYQTSKLRHTAWGKIYRRHLWKNLRFPPGWFEDLHISVDLFPQARKLAFIPESLYFYRRHSGSYLSRADASRADAVKASQHILTVCNATYPLLRNAASDRLFSASFNLLMMLSVHPCAIEPSVSHFCRHAITVSRRATLLNRHVRLINRIAALLSYLGAVRILDIARTLTTRFAK